MHVAFAGRASRPPLPVGGVVGGGVVGGGSVAGGGLLLTDAPLLQACSPVSANVAITKRAICCLFMGASRQYVGRLISECQFGPCTDSDQQWNA